MTHDDVLAIVNQHINLARQNSDEEYRKVEFKYKWYDLKNEHEIMEFLKDVCSMVNAFGPDGYIIIGFDAGQGFNNSTLKDSKLNDETELIDLVNSRVDRMFHLTNYDVIFEGKSLSVIHIPSSINKPHVIPKYKTWDKKGNERIEEHKIWVRYGKSCRPASRNDIELMIYDRKNIIPEYKLVITINKGDMQFSSENICMCMATIENSGTRPVAIAIIGFTLIYGDRLDDYYKLRLNSHNIHVIGANAIIFIRVDFIYQHLARSTPLGLVDVQQFNKNKNIADWVEFKVMNTNRELIPSEFHII
jgi:hypothetical protein